MFSGIFSSIFGSSGKTSAVDQSTLQNQYNQQQNQYNQQGLTGWQQQTGVNNVYQGTGWLVQPSLAGSLGSFVNPFYPSAYYLNFVLTKAENGLVVQYQGKNYVFNLVEDMVTFMANTLAEEEKKK